MLTRSRAAVLVLVGLTLAACGTIHPGSAAVVDGESISMRTLDRTATAYCVAIAASDRQQSGAPTTSNSSIRRQAVVGLVSLVVARKLAAAEDLTIKPSAYEVTSAERAQLSRQYPDGDPEQLARAIEDSREVAAIAVALAAEQTGEQPSAANEQQLAQLGQSTILAAFADNDVSFAPRFGLDTSGRPKADTGSVSVAANGLEALADGQLPAAQRCA
jgi:hypothetical protein